MAEGEEQVLRQQVDRLQRRLARERAARKSAEGIAERQTFELYEANIALEGQGARLQEALGYLRATLDHMVEILVVLDRDDRVKLVNRAFLRTFGLGEAEVVGQPAESVLDPELYGILVGGGGVPDFQSLQLEVPLPGARVGLASLSAIHLDPNGGEQGERIGTVALIRDVTMAKEIDRMKTDFISNVSHELRTPLTSILGFTKIIRRNMDRTIIPAHDPADSKLARATEKVRSNLEIIIAEGDRLTNLINDVLDVAKMEAGSITWNMEELSLGVLIDRVAAATSSLFDGRDVAFVRDVEPGLPPVEGDRDRLIQVLINLVSNAAKFTDEGSVTCRARRDGDEIVVSVADTGLGIAEDEIDQVFEKFKQVGDTLTDKPKGTGLGLPISRQIVLHHGGRIWAESELGVGSTFSFTLPIPAVEPVAAAVAHGLDLEALVSRLAGHGLGDALLAGGGPGRTVLLVDDEPSIREYLKQELEAGGYRVVEARDGLEGIAKAKELQPDLVILDVMMPKMNGFDAAAVLKNDPRTSHIPIMIHSIVEDRERGYRLGIDRYLAKPAETATLLNEVAALTRLDDAAKTILVVAADRALADLVAALERPGVHAIETATGEDCVERARAVKPDVVIVDATVPGHQAVVRRLRADGALERIPLYLLADEQAARP